MSNFEKQRFTAMMKYPFDLCFSISAASQVMYSSSFALSPSAKSTVKTVSNPSLTEFELTRKFHIAIFLIYVSLL